MALPLATDVEVLGAGGSGGVTMGESTTELISFYGVTPIAQRSGAAQSTLTLTTIATADSGWMFKTSDGFNALFNQVIEIAQTLKVLGLWKGSA